MPFHVAPCDRKQSRRFEAVNEIKFLSFWKASSEGSSVSTIGSRAFRHCTNYLHGAGLIGNRGWSRRLRGINRLFQSLRRSLQSGHHWLMLRKSSSSTYLNSSTIKTRIKLVHLSRRWSMKFSFGRIVVSFKIFVATWASLTTARTSASRISSPACMNFWNSSIRSLQLF